MFAVDRDTDQIFELDPSNGTVLRLARDAYAGRRGGGPDTGSDAPLPAAEPTFVALQREVLLPRCSPCHEFYCSISGKDDVIDGAEVCGLATIGCLDY